MIQFRKLTWYLIIGCIIIFFDQLTKWLVLNLGQGGFFVIPHFLSIETFRNRGIAFGLSIPYLILYILVVAVLIVCFWQLRQGIIKRDSFLTASLTLVISGALSNLFDRISRGYVVDYIHLPLGSVFNLADIAIVVGVGMLIWREIKSKNDQ